MGVTLIFVGMGQYLQGADWANNGKKSIDAVTGLKTLKTAGKTVMGASSAMSSVAANKLVGNQASFRWGNVAASALTSAVAPGEYGAIGKEIMNPISGIIQSGIQYGADKLFGNQASWNFGNVAVDAFGNALGNSIVSKLASQPKTYKEGDTYTNQDATTSIVGGVDENGQPTALVNVYSGLNDERELYAKWRREGDAQAAALAQRKFEYREASLEAHFTELQAQREVTERIERLVSTVPEVYKGLGTYADMGLDSISNSPEGREVSRLMHNFVTGEGPSETFYDSNSPLTKSMMTTDSTERNWQGYLSTRAEQIRAGGVVDVWDGDGAWGVHNINGAKAIYDATYPNHYLDPDPVRHFVGTYDVTIFDNGNGTATVEIFNETSVSSFTRNFFSAEKRIESFNRVPNNYGVLTPYGTISQTFTEVRAYPDWVLNSKGEK